MSTTKDKSQAELLAEKEIQDAWIVADQSIVDRSDERRAFVKGYEAGQADRDELVKALQRVEDELHKRYAHPDYEYEHSTTGRKQPDLKGEQLESEGWEEYKFQRDEWTDSRSYRRKKTITPNP